MKWVVVLVSLFAGPYLYLVAQMHVLNAFEAVVTSQRVRVWSYVGCFVIGLWVLADTAVSLGGGLFSDWMRYWGVLMAVCWFFEDRRHA